MISILLAAWVVVTGESPAPEIAYAAEEFTNAVFRCTGDRLEIAAKAPQGASVVSIRAKGANVTLENEKLGYRSSPGRLDIVGNQPRAALHATYQYLQRELGVRWLWIGETGAFYPKRDGFDVPDGLRYGHVPTIRYRGFHLCGGGTARQAAYEWMARNCATIHRDGVREGERKYGFYNFRSTHNACLSNKYFKDHPEWFSEFKGVRRPMSVCWSSEEAFQVVLNEVARHIGTSDILGIFPADTQDYCQCAECAKRSVSDNWFTYYNRLVAGLRKIKPGMEFATIAYQGYRPAPKDVVPDAAFIEVATHGRCNAHGYGRCPDNVREAALLDSWYKVGVPIGEYTYEFDVFDKGRVWLPIFSLVDDDLTHAARHGHVVQIPETSIPHGITDYREFGVFRHRFVEHFMMAKNYDAKITLDDWMDDTCRVAFGPAGDAVNEYFRIMDAAWSNMPRHPGIGISLILWVQDLMTPETVSKAESALARAEAAVASAEPRYRENVAQVRSEFAAWQAALAVRNDDAVAADPEHTLVYFCGSPSHEAANLPMDRQVAKQAGWKMLFCTNEAEVVAALPKAKNVWFRFASAKQFSEPTLEKVRDMVKKGGVWFVTSYWNIPLDKFTGDATLVAEKTAGADVPMPLRHPTFVRGGSWNSWPNDIAAKSFSMRMPSYIYRGAGDDWKVYLKCRAKEGGETPFLSTHPFGKGLVVLGGERLGLPWCKLLENLRAAELSPIVHMRAIADGGLFSEDAPIDSFAAVNGAWKGGAKWINAGVRCLDDGRVVTGGRMDQAELDALIKKNRRIRMPDHRALVNSAPIQDGIVQVEITEYGTNLMDRLEGIRHDRGMNARHLIVSARNLNWLADCKRREPAFDTVWIGCGLERADFDLDKAIAAARKANCRVLSLDAAVAAKKLKIADAEKIRSSGLDLQLNNVESPKALAVAMALRATAFTTRRWKESLEWAKKLKGLEVTP